MSQLLLSADQLILACVTQNSVAFYSVPDLAAGASSAPRPLAQQAFDAAIKQFVWAKAEGQVAHYLVLTEDHTLLTATYPSPPVEVASDVEAADWSPAGSQFVFSSGSSLVFADAAQPDATIAQLQVAHPDGECAMASHSAHST